LRVEAAPRVPRAKRPKMEEGSGTAAEATDVKFPVIKLNGFYFGSPI
jgi:hypothetical protein